jgi:hypothetical protein
MPAEIFTRAAGITQTDQRAAGGVRKTVKWFSGKDARENKSLEPTLGSIESRL